MAATVQQALNTALPNAKTAFLISGVGVVSDKDDVAFLKANTKVWGAFEAHLEHPEPTVRHAVRTVATHLALCELWGAWGIAPDLVVAHSLGEVSAAYLTGMYTLEETIDLTVKLAMAAASTDAWMAHGFDLKPTPGAHIVSHNWTEGGRQHATAAGQLDAWEGFVAANPEAKRMHVTAPWHLPGTPGLASCPTDVRANKSGIALFTAHQGGACAKLGPSDWDAWLRTASRPVDAFAAAAAAHAPGSFACVEIGMHPVMREMAVALQPRCYVTSAVRGEPLGPTLAEGRAPLLGAAFDERQKAAIDAVAKGADPSRPLLAQGFTSSMMVALAGRLAPLYPGVKPHDLYRHGSVAALREDFGRSAGAGPSVTAGAPAVAEPAVVVGASCLLPGGAMDMAAAWEFLQAGGNGVSVDARVSATACGYVQELWFDHDAFGMTEAEAQAMDPQQVVALQLTDCLLKDSQLDPAKLWGSRTGVYIGVWNTDYQGAKDSAYRVTGSNPSIIPARISRQWNLKGPSRVINTACSSSLEAVLDGLRDLQAGRVDYAIAGGVNMLWAAEFTESMRSGGFLSATGGCKAFSTDADGYTRAEGGGLVLLARQSMVEGYRAMLRGGASNHIGYSPLITVPSSEAQEGLIRAACSDAGIAPAQLDYIECHGTGTKIGDPIELSGLANLMRAEARDEPCLLGSAKANFGHLESAAGIVGVIKAVLVLTEQRVPPTPHLKTLNENLDLCGGKLRIEPSGADATLRFAGISSFGFGGSNAHLILERGDAPRATASGYRAPAGAEAKGVRFVRPLKDAVADTKPAPSLSADPAAVRSMVLASLKRMNIDPEQDMGTPLLELGLDSLGVADLALQMQKTFGVELELKKLAGGQYSADELIGEIAAKATVTCAEGAEPAAAAPRPAAKGRQPENTARFDADLYCTRLLKPEGRIKTTHVGSLPRVDGDTPVRAIYRQLDVGLDFVNDGEFSRMSYAGEILDSMTGFEDNICTGPLPRDLHDCPDCARRFMGRTALITLNPQIETKSPACVGEIAYVKTEGLHARLKGMVEALHANGLEAKDGFYTVPSPGTLLCFFENRFYENDEVYLAALARATAVECEAIAASGLMLQVDCPDLAMGRHTKYKGCSEGAFCRAARMHIKYLNESLRNVPAEQCRLHVCWGNYAAPHHRDISLERLVPILNQAKPQVLLIEGANARHQHEYKFLAGLSSDKIVVPGVVDSSSQHVEHPETVAERICRVAAVVGVARTIAGTDCGYATTAQSSSLPGETSWMKLRALVQGAAIATNRLSPSPEQFCFKPRAQLRFWLFGAEPPAELDPRAEYRLVPAHVTDVQRIAEHIKQFADIPAVFCAEKPSAQDLAGSVAKALAGTASYPSAVRKEAGFARTGAAAIDDCISEIRVTFDRERLKLPKVPPRRDHDYDVLVIGAGLTGLHVADKLAGQELDVAVLEKSDKIGGIWDVFANDTSQVNTSEGAYRLNTADRSRANKDHSTTREVLEDALAVAARLEGRIHLGIAVSRVERDPKASGEAPRYAVTLADGTVLRAGGVVLAINDRVGVPRAVTWAGQETFKGKIVNGFGNDAVDQGVDWVGKEVIVVGFGAFAIENVRTALERGARRVTVVARRHGTVCPKHIDYINFVNKDGSDVNQDSVANTHNMIVWRRLYEQAGATMPECWMGNIKHYGHTISVSDHWWVGHHLGICDSIASDIDHFEPDGLVTQDGQFVTADIVVRCTGFERNASLVPALSPYTQTNSINYLDQDVMYLADALLDDEVFNSMFGSSVLEMAKFFCTVYAYFFKHKEEYRTLVGEGAFHEVPITERKWSDYIAGTNVLLLLVPALKAAASEQVRTRQRMFLDAHTVEEFKRENRREWESLSQHLAVWAPGIPPLPYPDW